MEIVTKIAPIALALIMLGLGLGLSTQDFTRVLKQPRDFLIGFVCQLILLPVIAFILIKLINIPVELALGVMIIAAAPGGVTSNILTKFAGGDVALRLIARLSTLLNDNQKIILRTAAVSVGTSPPRSRPLEYRRP